MFDTNHKWLAFGLTGMPVSLINHIAKGVLPYAPTIRAHVGAYGNTPDCTTHRKQARWARFASFTILLLLAACVTPPKPPVAPQLPVAPFAASKWGMLPDWQTLDLSPSWPAFLQSCRALKNKAHWQEICASAEQAGASDSAALRTFYETWFTPYQVRNPDGSEQGLITGYYEPRLYGSRTKTARFRYPLYAAPDDLLTIDLGAVYPQLKDLRLRGRLQGKRVVPYYSRAEIDANADSSTAANGHGKCATPDDDTCHDRSPLSSSLDETTSHSTKLPNTAAKSLVIPQAGESGKVSLRELHVNALKARELFWVDNAVELFFLQVQGSGRIELPDGKLMKVGYADQNGHPYISIGKKLVETGELKLEEASMQGIKNWAEKNPDKLPALLAQNPSYVFFRELPDSLSAPLGALGVPLADAYSLAVDARTIPLGVPVFLSTTYPNDNAPLDRLMLAQDTGGAIRGAVRADFFWGFGEAAATQAGKMKQQGRMWVLFPKGGEPTVN